MNVTVAAVAHRGLQVLGAVGALLIVGSRPAVADSTCVSPAVGVPFNPGPPRWHEIGNVLNSRIDDPRWKKAASITHGNSTVEQVNFRALHFNDTLFLSWWIKVAPIPNGNDWSQNMIYVGLQPSSGGTALMILLKLKSGSASAAGPSDYQVSLNTVDAMGNYNVIATPAWLDDVRVWSNLPIPNRWAFNIKVPTKSDIGSGVILTPAMEKAFRMWYEVLQGSPAAQTGILYTWPRDITIYKVTSMGGFSETLPQPSSWPYFYKSTGSGDPKCATGGITIESADIFTDNPNGSWLIDLVNPNTFHATPTNLTGNPVNIGDVHARFRIANWGLQADPNNTNTATFWQDVRLLGDVTQAGVGTVPNGGKWNITGTYQYDATQDPAYDDVNHWTHQCILVDLSGPNLRFIQNSAHTNMNVGTASTFRDRAQISLVDARPMTNGRPDRAVYLYVQATNMPVEVGKGGSVDSEPPQTPSRPTAARLAPPTGVLTPGMVSDTTDTTDMLAYRLPELERRALTEPTITVHGYYETGDTIAAAGVRRAVLLPMTSFGYFVHHEGPVTGWKYGISGSNVVEIAPNFYKVVMPANGKAPIQLKVRAKQPLVETLKHVPWWVWLLILLILIVLGLFFRKPKLAPTP